VDAFELQNVLNSVFTRDFQFDGFNQDMTRSMVAMKDSNFSGKLGSEDFKSLWSDLTLCKQVFKQMDTDRSGHFSGYELREALASIGYRVSNATFNAVVVRFSDKEGNIRFDDFVMCYIKLKTLFDGFRSKDKAGYGSARFSFDEFTEMTMYS